MEWYFAKPSISEAMPSKEWIKYDTDPAVKENYLQKSGVVRFIDEFADLYHRNLSEANKSQISMSYPRSIEVSFSIFLDDYLIKKDMLLSQFSEDLAKAYTDQSNNNMATIVCLQASIVDCMEEIGL